MAVSPINVSQTVSALQTQIPVQPQVQPQVQTASQKTGGTSKAILSVIPGLGQICDGRTSTGLKFLGGILGAYIASKAMPFLQLAIASTGKPSRLSGWGILLSGVAGLAMKVLFWGLYVANFIDAYNGKKK